MRHYIDYIYYHCGIRATSRFLASLKKGFSLKIALFNDVDVLRCDSTTKFPHPIGLVIGVKHMGTCCVIYQNTTIGQRYPGGGYPTIGNNVIIYASCLVLGEISIGDHAIIGAGSIVLKDVPENTIVTGIWK